LALLLVLVGPLAPWAVSPVGAQSDQALYERARKDYQWLATNPRGKVVYQNWQSLYDRFASIYTADPYGELVPQCLWWMGRVRAGAWEQFQRQSDFLEAVDLYRRFINHFPRSRLADDAQFNLGRLYEQAGDKQQAYLEYLRLTVNQPKGDMLPQAKARLDALEKELRPAGGSRPAAEPAQRPAGEKPLQQTLYFPPVPHGKNRLCLELSSYLLPRPWFQREHRHQVQLGLAPEKGQTTILERQPARKGCDQIRVEHVLVHPHIGDLQEAGHCPFQLLVGGYPQRRYRGAQVPALTRGLPRPLDLLLGGQTALPQRQLQIQARTRQLAPPHLRPRQRLQHGIPHLAHVGERFDQDRRRPQ
jgi:hypothetical protein